MSKAVQYLIDIYDTKERMKSALGTSSDDICSYPTLIYNYFTNAWNNNYPTGYDNGYTDAYQILLGTDPTEPHAVIERRSIREYTSNIPTVTDYRDSRLVSDLTSIMNEVLTSRLGMKAELYTNSDDFTIYPDLLNYMILNEGVFERIGYDDGWDEACENLGITRPNPPSIFYVDNTVTIGGKGVLYYSLDGINFNQYTEPFEITSDTLVFSYCTVDDIPSITVNCWCEYGVAEYPRTPLITSSNSVVTITNRENTGTIKYSLDGENFSTYTGPITLTEDTIVYSYVTINELDSSIVQKFCEGGNLFTRPLTFEILSNGYIEWLGWNTDPYHPEYFVGKTIIYKKNDGEWISITSRKSNTSNPPPQIAVSRGDVVKFVGNNQTYYDSADYAYFSTTCDFNASGNIFSLCDRNNFSNPTLVGHNNYAFKNLFRNCTGLKSIENLVFPGGSIYIDSRLWKTNAYCEGAFENMFKNCTGLINAGTTIGLFDTVLTGPNCCASMFNGCTSLVTPPTLPISTTIGTNCYASMFEGCTSLYEAPELPASTVGWEGYQYMFKNCSNLRKIKCLASNFYATTPTSFDEWMMNVYSDGIFIKLSGVNYPTGYSGIPSGWTVQNA